MKDHTQSVLRVQANNFYKKTLPFLLLLTVFVFGVGMMMIMFPQAHGQTDYTQEITEANQNITGLDLTLIETKKEYSEKAQEVEAIRAQLNAKLEELKVIEDKGTSIRVQKEELQKKVQGYINAASGKPSEQE